MVKWKTITIDKDGTFHKFKYTTDNVHINRKLGTGNNKFAFSKGQRKKVIPKRSSGQLRRLEESKQPSLTEKIEKIEEQYPDIQYMQEDEPILFQQWQELKMRAREQYEEEERRQREELYDEREQEENYRKLQEAVAEKYPHAMSPTPQSDEDVELRQPSTDSLGGRKKKTRKSLFRKSLLKKKRTKRRKKRGYGGKSSKRRKTKKRRTKRGYVGKSPKRRKRKQKGGGRTPGNWLKISEIQAADVCIYCGQTLMNPRTPEKTAYMMSCCVDEVTGEGFLAHTGCIHGKCENNEVNCPMCDDSIHEACLDIETYYNPGPDILVPAPITLNEELEYYNPELLPYEVRQEAMPGGGSLKFIL